jgi:general secretion pathway protein K
MKPVMPIKRGSAGQSGVALVIVLWTTTLLALLVAGFAASVQSDARIVSNSSEVAKASALIDAGIELAALELYEQRPEERIHPDGSLFTHRLGEASIRMSILDANGLIDINKADDALLLSLLLSLGLEDEQAVALRDAILDWRDADDLSRLNGAEDIDYRRADLDHEAGDRPFQSLSQLRGVLGMTSEIYRALLPLVTLANRGGRINPTTAPPEVLAALPNIQEPDVEDALLLRREQPDNAEAIMARLAVARDYLQPEAGPLYRVGVEARLPGGLIQRGQAVILVRLDKSQPYRVLERSLLLEPLHDPYPSEPDEQAQEDRDGTEDTP